MTSPKLKTEDPVEEAFNRIREKKEPESWEQWKNRTTERLKARAGETVLGLPGGLKKTFQQSKEFIESYLPEEVKELSKGIKEYQQETKSESGSVSEFIMNPPTAVEIREKGTKKLAKHKYGNADYLEPRNDFEKATDEFTQDLTAMFTPGTGQMRLMTRIGAPVMGNLVKQGLKFVGVEEKTAEKAKFGTMLATTLALQSNPSQFANERIQAGRSMVPPDMMVSAQPVARQLFPLYQRMQRGFQVGSKSKTMQGITELQEQAAANNGRLNMHSLMDARDNINEWISEAGGWDVPRPVRDATVTNLNDLKRTIIDTIDSNLQARLPQAAELYRSGYEAAAVTHQSNAISNFIEKHFGKKMASVGAKLLFPAAAAGGALAVPKTAIIAGGLFPAYKAGQVLYRVGQSPTLAHYYADVIEASIRGNAAEMVHSLSKLDNELEKEEKRRKKNSKLSLEEFKMHFIEKD